MMSRVSHQRTPSRTRSRRIFCFFETTTAFHSSCCPLCDDREGWGVDLSFLVLEIYESDVVLNLLMTVLVAALSGFIKFGGQSIFIVFFMVHLVYSLNYFGA